ncbi:MAG: hypothetical protein LW847_15285 [Burkholderiales bacterium]|jgi:DNA mismatch endonuclease (patch repair protein)|nr:hypothetical protein [Burkholderiales bacterium]
MNTAAKRVHMSRKTREAAAEQDAAAGAAELRKMRTKTGDVVTVSLSVSPSGGASRVILRFKWGGGTVQRPVANVNAESRAEALREGWRLIREKQIVEKEGWSWVVPST